MNNHDPVDRLRNANPFPAGDGSEHYPAKGFDAHLEEILMTAVLTPTDNVSTSANVEQLDRPKKRKSRTAARLTAVAALVAAVVLGSTLATTNSAVAQVVAAAEASSNFDSGRVLVEIVFNTVESEPELNGGSATSTYRFDGDRTHLESDDFGETSEIIEIGNDIYHRGFFIDGDVELAEGYEEATKNFTLSQKDSTSLELPTTINPETIKPEFVIPFLESAGDLTQVTSEGDTTIYSGTVSRSSLAGLDEDEVPAGITPLVIEGGAADLPETVDVEVTVEQQRLTRLDVLVQGETADGFVDVAITTTFGDFGQPQNISAPPPDRVVDEVDQFVAMMPDDIKQANETLNNFLRDNPDVCAQEVTAWLEVVTQELAFDEYEVLVPPVTDAYLGCLEANAPAEVTEAARLLHG